jgi:hypothetical protein
LNEALKIEFENNHLTLNEWRVKLGEDKLEKTEGDLYYYELLALGWTFGKAAAPAPKTEEDGTETESGAAAA